MVEVDTYVLFYVPIIVAFEKQNVYYICSFVVGTGRERQNVYGAFEQVLLS